MARPSRAGPQPGQQARVRRKAASAILNLPILNRHCARPSLISDGPSGCARSACAHHSMPLSALLWPSVGLHCTSRQAGFLQLQLQAVQPCRSAQGFVPVHINAWWKQNPVKLLVSVIQCTQHSSKSRSPQHPACLALKMNTRIHAGML